MEILKKRHESLLQALLSLKKSINLIQNYTKDNDEEVYAAFRDSCIQRFEYSFDAFWKFIKLYLEDYQGVDLQANSPRYILKVALDKEILTKNHNDLLEQALSDRNLTSHSYNVETAEKIVRNIPSYYETIHTIAISIKL